MPRKKQVKTTDTPPITLEGQAILETLRSNMKLLGELAMHYEVTYQPERPAEMPTINCPAGRSEPPGAGDEGLGPGAVAGCCCSTPVTR